VIFTSSVTDRVSAQRSAMDLLVRPTLALRYGRFHEGKADDELLGFPGSDAEQRSCVE
jgi:hypothetical protein